MSQSLWNRAVSYDKSLIGLHPIRNSLNPFGTGQCLTTQEVFQIDNTLFGLNPFGTGQCLTTALELSEKQRKGRLNPFGTGQCLTTMNGLKIHTVYVVSIPLEQGSVLRQAFDHCFTNPAMSQSLWNRAVSYDGLTVLHQLLVSCLNPFGTGQCLTTLNAASTIKRKKCLNPFGTGQCLTTKSPVMHLTH